MSEFLIELSIALHRHSMYPSGHPSLEPAITSVVRRADHLLQSRQTLAFGVARRQLIIEGVTTDPDQPVLRRLAETLHRHHLGAISLTQGLEADELAAALLALSAEPDPMQPVGRGRAAGTADWVHVRLHPLTFEGLSIVNGHADPGAAAAPTSEGAELWVGLARAALSVDEHGGQGGESTEPSAVARAIDEHAHAEAYDQVVVGHLLQIARDLKASSGADADALRRRVSALIASLRPETLRRLIEMGGDVGQRNAFVLDASHTMAVDAVIEIVQAAAEANGQTISHGLVRMLAKLASHAESGSARMRPLADAALREQVQHLLSDWQLEDPNPEQYGRVLHYLATSSRDERASGEAIAADPDPIRIVQMSLETGVLGPQGARALSRAASLGHVGAVLDLLASVPDEGRATADAILERFLTPDTLRSLLAKDPLDTASLDGLLPFMSPRDYDVLLDALCSSPSRLTRRKLMDRLARTPADIGTGVIYQLEHGPWFVQRNMLMLLQRRDRLPAGFSPEPWTHHEDPRVRNEAIRLQLMMPEERDLAVRLALDDRDPIVVLLALTAIQSSCPPNFADRVARLALDPAQDEEVRRVAVQALGPLRQVQALQTLLQIADGGRTFLGRPRLAATSPVVLAALKALATRWPDDPRAGALLTLAADSSDADVRFAARVRPS
jgi:hypothetical protein